MNNSDEKALFLDPMGNPSVAESVAQPLSPARPWAADRLLLIPGVVACRPRTGASALSLQVLMKGALQEAGPGLLFSTFEVASDAHERRDGTEDP